MVTVTQAQELNSACTSKDRKDVKDGVIENSWNYFCCLAADSNKFVDEFSTLFSK